MLIYPHDADDDEADHVGGERGPSLRQLMGEVLKVVRLSDGEDKKRDGDREYSIDDRLDGVRCPCCFLSPRGSITTSRRCSNHRCSEASAIASWDTWEHHPVRRDWGWLATPRTGWS